jgi:hypothetical protein
MGWSLRKSFRLLPGVRVNLSRSGPRVSVGVPGARASVDMHGKARIYGGKGPIRFQKAVALGDALSNLNMRLSDLISGVFGRRTRQTK